MAGYVVQQWLKPQTQRRRLCGGGAANVATAHSFSMARIQPQNFDFYFH